MRWLAFAMGGLALAAVPACTEETTAPAQHADLDLTIAELWAQRFEDNQFRAKQRLDQKQIRVTGTLDSVSDRTVTLFGTGARFGSISLLAQLDDAYIKQVMEGLAALQKGLEVTVQGRFLCDKMWLQDAAIIDRKTGKRLAAKELMALSSSPSAAPGLDVGAASSIEKP